MKKTILILALLILAVFASVQPRQDDFKALWGVWKSLYSKAYGPGEETLRYQVFIQNYELILRHNREDHSYKLGLNQFADLTVEEFKSKHLGFIPNISNITENSGETESLDSQLAATTVDWRTKGVVTKIKDQGTCGACWAFSAVGAIESAVAIKGQKLKALSPQQLVDCSRGYGNQGCNGGLMVYAFQYVMKYGISSNTDYPYKGASGSCRSQSHSVAAKITNYKNVQFDSTGRQLAAAVTKTPVSVGIAAGSSVFQHYRSGILKASSCGTDLNHAGVVVGYTADAFIFKNSWGTSWGEKGYMRLGRTGNICGITMQPSYPIV